jgi:hypothetical protein
VSIAHDLKYIVSVKRDVVTLQSIVTRLSKDQSWLAEITLSF